MEKFGCEKGEKWQHDPHHIISNKGVEISYAPYIHESISKIEKIEIQETWPWGRVQQRMDVETLMVKGKSVKRTSPEQIDVAMKDS